MKRRTFISAATSGIVLGTASAAQSYDADILLGRQTRSVPSDLLKKYRLKNRYRPIPAGVNEGNVNMPFGYATNGPFIFETKDVSGKWSDDIQRGDLVRASNNHVYARSNKASLGEKILQPAPGKFGKRNKDTVGKLKGYVPLKDGVSTDVAFRSVSPLDELLTIKSGNFVPPSGRRTNYDSLELVFKYGARTGLTIGKARGLVDILVGYPTGTKRITNVLKVTADGEHFVNGGDSGSPVIDSNENLVGIVFAESRNSSTGYVITLDAIEREAGVRYVGANELYDRLERYDRIDDDRITLFDVLEYYNDTGNLFESAETYNRKKVYNHWYDELDRNI